MGRKKPTEGQTLGLKLCFYVMSLLILFICIFLLTFPEDFLEIPWGIMHNPFWLHKFGTVPIMFWISFVGILAGIGATYYIHCQWKGVKHPAYQIESVRKDDYQYLLFLSTYIIPLVCMDFKNERYCMILFFLLGIIGYISVNMDIYYGNPSLCFLGYRLYQIKVKDENLTKKIRVISKDILQEGDFIRWMPIEATTWVVKEIKHDE